MSDGSRASWPPWRGPNAVRWTLALALCLVAVVAVVVDLPSGRKPPPSIPAVAFAGSVASTERSRGDRSFNACLAGVAWWIWSH